MATINSIGRFAEQVLRVERVLDEHRLSGSAGRVTFILAAAYKAAGVTQKQLIDEADLPKDVVSKLVSSLVKAGLLIRDREGYDPRVKRLHTTETGRSIIVEINAALQAPSAARQKAKQTTTAVPFDFGV
jgi:DNA-binding MarR family transcriptional regulator